MNNDCQSISLKEINRLTIARMVAQTRSKQLGTRDIQHTLLALIKEKLLEEKDSSGEQLWKGIIKGLERDCYISKRINNFLDQTALQEIGYAIKTNKTAEQLSMALKWVQSQEESFITNLLNGKLYHGLSNTIASDALPILQSPSNKLFWGNENPSVSTAMLISIAATLNIKPDRMKMIAAATVYPFCKRDFQLPSDLVAEPYPFASQHSMLLIGEYQYGGQRNWAPANFAYTDAKNQLLLGPEDCSSAVGKASYCTINQVKNLNSNEIIKAYYNQDNVYHYRPTTCLQGNIGDKQLRLIHPGDIYVVKGHAAIVATKADHKGNVVTLQFNRDINPSTQEKQSGGGLYSYNLYTKSKAQPIFILNKALPWKESSSLKDFLRKIQEKYEIIFPNGPVDKLGDCSLFYE